MPDYGYRTVKITDVDEATGRVTFTIASGKGQQIQWGDENAMLDFQMSKTLMGAAQLPKVGDEGKLGLSFKDWADVLGKSPMKNPIKEVATSTWRAKIHRLCATLTILDRDGRVELGTGTVDVADGHEASLRGSSLHIDGDGAYVALTESGLKHFGLGPDREIAAPLAAEFKAAWEALKAHNCPLPESAKEALQIARAYQVAARGLLRAKEGDLGVEEREIKKVLEEKR